MQFDKASELYKPLRGHFFLKQLQLQPFYGNHTASNINQFN